MAVKFLCLQISENNIYTLIILSVHISCGVDKLTVIWQHIVFFLYYYHEPPVIGNITMKPVIGNITMKPAQQIQKFSKYAALPFFDNASHYHYSFQRTR